MSRSGLLKDVSMDELVHMRESGMSNTDIANALGVSRQSIYRYLGREYGRGGLISKGIMEYNSGDKLADGLNVTCMEIRLKGAFASYRLRLDDGMIDISFTGEESASTLSLDDAEQLAEEIKSIAKKAKGKRW